MNHIMYDDDGNTIERKEERGKKRSYATIGDDEGDLICERSAIPQVVHEKVKLRWNRISGLRFASESWQGRKDTNEDRHVVVLDQFPGAVFALFDGHAGNLVAEYLTRHLIKNICNCVRHHVGIQSIEDIHENQAVSIEETSRLETLQSETEISEAQLNQVDLLRTQTQSVEVDQLYHQLTESIKELKKCIEKLRAEEKKRDEAQRKLWDNIDQVMQKGFHEAFARTDSHILQKFPGRDGSTAVLCWLIGHKLSDLILYTLNLGDSRVVLCRNKVAVPLTRDHKPNLSDERRRIVAAGGFVSEISGISRVYSAAGAGLSMELSKDATYLAVSRAFGDRALKHPTQCVSCEPEIRRYYLQGGDEFVVMACDGVWDVMTNQEAVDIVLQHVNDEHAAAKAVVKEAYRRGSLDNLTATVVLLSTTPVKCRNEDLQVNQEQHTNELLPRDDDEEVDMFNL